MRQDQEMWLEIHEPSEVYLVKAKGILIQTWGPYNKSLPSCRAASHALGKLWFARVRLLAD